MFTGIVECLGKVIKVEEEQTNKIFTIQAPFTNELKVDQSIAHSGVCLTVVEILKQNKYKVVAIKETLEVTNLNNLKAGSLVNLERCLAANGRLDGHFVQGHVDSLANCTKIKEEDGSWLYTFSFQPQYKNLLVNKGSVTINGTSLTVIKLKNNSFKTAIIPYTKENTVFKTLSAGDSVNIEFDILGKYIQRFKEKK